MGEQEMDDFETIARRDLEGNPGAKTNDWQ